MKNASRGSNSIQSGLPTRGLFVLAVLLTVLAGCGSKNVADWMRDANSIDELRIVHGCAVAVENMDKALTHRRDGTFLPFGGDFTKADPEEGECGRYIVHSALSSAPNAVIILERRLDGDTNLTVYQQDGTSIHSRQFVAKVESWANGFVTAE